MTQQTTKRGAIFGTNPHYQFKDQAPVMDEMALVWRASGWKVAALSRKTGLSSTTLYNWFTKQRTRCPRHDSVQIFFNSFGIPYGVIGKVRVIVQQTARREAAVRSRAEIARAKDKARKRRAA